MQEIDLATMEPDIKKILLIGHEGVGKTHFIGSMPKPVYIFSFDKGIATLAGIPGIKAGIFVDDNRYSPKAFAEFKLQWELFKSGKLKYTWPGGKEEAYKTVAIDSITAMSKYIFDHEQRINNTTDKPAGYTPYTNTKSKLQDMVIQSVALADYVVVTALVEASKDDTTGEIFYTPSTEGKFREEAGQWFDAVFFLSVDKNPNTGVKMYKMATVGDKRSKAKIRIPSSLAGVISAFEDPDFEKLMDKINKAKQAQKPVQTTGGK